MYFGFLVVNTSAAWMMLMIAVHATTKQIKMEMHCRNISSSIDGKHICIKWVPKTGSLYFKYKGYFSVILLSCADANGLFITVCVEDVGFVFRACIFGKCWRRKDCISHFELPYC
jgi:hypothetical protein